MNYDVYEVEIDTGIPGYRLLQHIKATDANDAMSRVQSYHPDSAIKGAILRRPCTLAEVAVAVKAGIVPDGTMPTVVQVDPAPVDPTQDAAP